MAGNTYLYRQGGDRNLAGAGMRVGEGIELAVGKAGLASLGHEHALAGKLLLQADGAAIGEHAHLALNIEADGNVARFLSDADGRGYIKWRVNV